MGTLADVFAKWPHLERVLPAMGYGDVQRRDLAQTINNASADIDVVIVRTPIDLAAIIDLEVPSVRVFYDLEGVPAPPSSSSSRPTWPADRPRDGFQLAATAWLSVVSRRFSALRSGPLAAVGRRA